MNRPDRCDEHRTSGFEAASIREDGPAPPIAAGSPIRANGSPRAIRSSADEAVELLCTDQVDRWRAGERIPAEAYLALHPTLHGGSEAAFELIYGEYLIRESLGESPKLEEFCWRFPGIRRSAPAAAQPAPAPWARPRTRTEVGPGGEAGADAAEGLAIPTVPGFEVLGILGQGGMSVVYLARQAAPESPGRAQGDPRQGLRRPRHRRPVPRRGRGRGALPSPQYRPGL